MVETAPQRVTVLGVPVDCVTMRDAVDVVENLVREKRQGTIIAVNPEKIIKAQADDELLEHLNRAALLIPDGIGAVWAVRMLRLGEIQRVAGADLMPEICARAAENGFRIFVYGASPDVNEKARAELLRRYPNLEIAGFSHGFRGDDEMDQLVDEINASKADILFIALGSPRQELWMAEHLPKTRVHVCQGVGGTLDVLAGSVRRAPAIWRRFHLEWAYRLLSQPRRIMRQTALPRFASKVLQARFLPGRGSGEQS